MEAGLNSCTLALRVLGSDEVEPSTWGYNWVTLLLGYIYGDLIVQVEGVSNLGQWKYVLKVMLDTSPNINSLSMRAQHLNNQRLSCYNKNMVLGLTCDLTPRQTGTLMVGCKIPSVDFELSCWLRRMWAPVVRSEMVVAEAGDISGTQKNGNVCRWKP